MTMLPRTATGARLKRVQLFLRVMPLMSGAAKTAILMAAWRALTAQCKLTLVFRRQRLQLVSLCGLVAAQPQRSARHQAQLRGAWEAFARC